MWNTSQTKPEKQQNRYTYNGEAFDKTTEQYYLRKRFYNPKLSRFIQEDEYRGDGLNLYAFCANNPVMYVDPSGYTETKCVSGGNDDESASKEYVNDKDIERYREEIGNPLKNGEPIDTVAVARTNIEGLEDYTFKGASTDVRKAAGLPDLDEVYPDRSIVAPYDYDENPRLTQFAKHAEEFIKADFEAALKKAGIDPSEAKGDLYMIQSFTNGVCNKCTLDLFKPSADGKKGIFKQFIERYPNVNLYVSTYKGGGNGRRYQ